MNFLRHRINSFELSSCKCLALRAQLSRILGLGRAWWGIPVKHRDNLPIVFTIFRKYAASDGTPTNLSRWRLMFYYILGQIKSVWNDPLTQLFFDLLSGLKVQVIDFSLNYIIDLIYVEIYQALRRWGGCCLPSKGIECRWSKSRR